MLIMNLKMFFKAMSLALLIITISVQVSYAENYSIQLKKAAYLFEMKGEANEALKILEDISRNGNEKERNEADFLIGKINDISGQINNASFFYKQNLLQTNLAAQAFWDAERLAKLNPEAEKMIYENLNLPANAKHFFNDDSVLILLTNNKIYNPNSKKQINLPADVSLSAKILHISDLGVWWQESNTLTYSPYQSIFPVLSIPIQTTLSEFLYLSPHSISYIDGEELVLLSGKNERFRSEKKYKDCSLHKSLYNQEILWLNCPDNALHMISKENGEELGTISMLDPITIFFQDKNGILLSSGDAIWFFSNNNLNVPQWRINSHIIEQVTTLNSNFVILEPSGNTLLIKKQNGEIISQKQTSANSLISLHTGSIALLSRNGELQALDTLLESTWNFHLGVSALAEPWVQNGILYYPHTLNSIKVLNALHYGKKSIQSQKMIQIASIWVQQDNWEKAISIIDSALTIEPGNLDGLFLKALYLEKTNAPLPEKEKAWAKAINLSTKNSLPKNKIFNHYAKIIGADYITSLPISQQTLYPQFFSFRNSLFTIDAASKNLIALNSKNGNLRWTHSIGKMESAPVSAHHNRWFALGSGFSLNILNIENLSQQKTMDLPGKIFNIYFTSDALFVSTWNGFLVKILLPNFQQAWSRKIGVEPTFTILHKKHLVSVTTNGDIQLLQNSSGLPINKKISLQAQIASLTTSDSCIAFITTDSRILLYTDFDAPLLTLSPGQDILNAEFIKHKKAGAAILLSLNNKELRLYSLPKGDIIWQHKGGNSVFGKFALHKNSLWIDKKNYLLEISLETGKTIKRLSIAGDAGSPFIADNMLFCPTNQQLLFGFNLDKQQ